MCFQLVHHFVAHVMWDSDHAVLNSHPINCIFGFSGIIFKELETAVIVKKLHHAQLVSTYTLKSLNLINNLIGQLLIIQFAHDKVSDRESIVSVNKLIKFFT